MTKNKGRSYRELQNHVEDASDGLYQKDNKAMTFLSEHWFNMLIPQNKDSRIHAKGWKKDPDAIGKCNKRNHFYHRLANMTPVETARWIS